MPEQWVSGAALALWETPLSCKSRRREMEKSPPSSSEKPFNPSPDLGKGAFLQGHGHGESGILVSLPSPSPGLPLATAAEPGPPGCCRSPRPPREQPVPLLGRAGSSRPFLGLAARGAACHGHASLAPRSPVCQGFNV